MRILFQIRGAWWHEANYLQFVILLPCDVDSVPFWRPCSGVYLPDFPRLEESIGLFQAIDKLTKSVLYSFICSDGYSL